MAALELQLLGSFRATLEGKKLESFRTQKAQALLIYLAVESEAHRRENLTAILWPGMPERSARSNLRQALFHLRRLIPELNASEQNNNKEGEPAVPLLLTNRLTIQLNPAADIGFDLRHFELLLEATRSHDHLDLLLCGECRERLEGAVELYRGDLLANFYLDDSNEFEDWAAMKRAFYRRKALDALEILTGMSINQKALAEARTYAGRQIEMDHLREGAYRQLMEIMALSGQHSEALALYDECSRILAEELGMTPAKRTTHIYEQILAGDLSFEAPLAEGVRGYEIQDAIGEGAYGAIHLAIQPSVGREVAVKVIHRKYANDPEFIRRFETEAQTVARLEHPYIVPLYDYWRDPDGAYLVMRYLRGGSLLSALESGPWDPEPAMQMIDQVTAALAAAHQQGVVHRDIKPANILLDESGNAYLSDFGIAKHLARETQLTAGGAVLGTPDYISPEQIKSEPVGPASDIYSLGAVLYETLTGERPYPDASLAELIHKHLTEPVPLVSESRPDLPLSIDDVIQRATAKEPADRYASALELAGAFRQALGGYEVEAPPSLPGPEVVEVYNPYKGLRAFQEADADDFFGRETLVDALVARLTPSPALPLEGRGGHFLAVVGPSGSGKSSAVKAGLVPALRESAIPGSDKWFVAEMAPGTHPLEELEVALWPIAVDPPPSLVEPMERDVRGMLRTIRRILPDEDDARLLLVIDQFEELFTLVDDEERREFFLDSLLAAVSAHHSPVSVVITLRADFYDRPLQRQPLGQIIKDNTEIVLPLNSAELTWAVREPARRVGVGLEEGLTEAIVADVADQPGALPLLQYAMTELFDLRQNGRISQDAYHEIGGVLGALGSRADEIYNSFSPEEQETSRQLFLRLVTLGEGVEDTRRRVLRSELEAIDNNKQSTENGKQSTVIASVIDALGAARLLTFDHDPVTREPTVEVAHEALLREWGRLRSWLDESRNDVRMQRMLAQAAGEWEASGWEPGFLLRETRLDQFAGWAAGSTVALTGDESAFLEASVSAREARLAAEEARRQRELETARQLTDEQTQHAEEQGHAARRLRWLAVGLAFVLLIALGLGVLANDQRATAQTNFVEAERIRLASQAQNALDRGEGGEVPALLAIRSLALGYSPEADAALLNALRRGFPLQEYVGHTDTVPQGNFTPDGRLLVTHSYDGAMRLWQAQTGEEMRQFVGHTGPIWRHALSPDGRTVLSSSLDGTARLWNTETAAELRHFNHNDLVTAAGSLFVESGYRSRGPPLRGTYRHSLYGGFLT